MSRETEQQRIKRIKGERAGYFAQLSLLFFKNRRLTAIVMTLLIGFGVLSYTTLLQREGFPSVDIPVSFGNGAFFVDDAEKVDQDIARPLGGVVQEVDGVESVTTFADSNFFQVVASLEDGVGNSEGNARILKAVDESGVLPDGVNLELPDFDAARFLGKYEILVAVYGPLGVDPAVLEEAAERFAKEFEKDEIVARAAAESLFTQGVDPRTGQQVTQQTSFGRVGTDNGSGFDFFNATVIGITGAGGEDLDQFELNEVVKKRIETIEAENGEGLSLIVAANFTDEISNQISSLQNNVFTGLLVVTIISALMISWRVSILTAIFMVSVIFATSAVLLILGYSLNTLTLFALVLALGLFVDDATIISESIDANKDKRLKKTEIIKHAINNVGSASFAGTLTTILVFVPLMFIGGILGSFIFLLPLTIVIALTTSLFLSLTLLPFLSNYSILTKKNIANKGWNNPIPEMLERAINALKTNRKVGVPWAVFAVGLSVVFIMGSGYYFQKLSFNIFPNSKDADELGLLIEYDPGSSIEDVQSVSDEINKIARDVVGENLTGVVYGGDSLPSTRQAVARLSLVSFRERDIKAPIIVENLESNLMDIEGAVVTVTQFDAGPPAETFPFRVQIFSENIELASTAAEDITGFLEGREIELQGGQTTTILETDYQFVTSAVRKDGRRYVEALAAYDSDDVSAVVQSTRDLISEEYDASKLASLGLAEDALEFDFGQESENEESFSSLGPAFMIAVLTMFTLLIIQFRSVTKPLLIFLALPFSLMGVALGLYLSNNPLSFFSMIGFIGLIGIAVNNTILLVDAANQEKRIRGHSTTQAIAAASKRRFRPLVTTTLTTVAALTPLALSDPFWEPLAVVIIAGLVSSTILVIVSFPYYYLAFDAGASWVVNKLRSARNGR